MPKLVVVFGATGFVGKAVVEALSSRGAAVVPMTTPRLPPTRADRAQDVLQGFTVEIASLARELSRADCVVNAAGVADASSDDESMLNAANALVPGYLAMAADVARVPRFVHVSSAAVQGRARVLDSSESVAPFSAYSRSKVLGEVLARRGHTGTVVYRPPGVHGPDRHITRLTARIARSRVSSVAWPVSSPSPQTLVQNAADAIAFLATTELQPPAVVAHPSEGLTTASVLTFLGDRRPLTIPRTLAKVAVATLTAGGKVLPPIAANARRAEMLWFGQSQAPSWLTEAGWCPPAGDGAWRELGQQLADSSAGQKIDMTRSSRTGTLRLIHVTTVPYTLHYFQGQIAFLKAHGFIVQAISSPDEEDSLAVFGSEEDIDVHPVPMTREIAPVSDIISLVRLWRTFRKLRPDIVHSHSPKAALLSTLAARIAGVPTVVVSIFGLRQMTKTGPSLRLLNAMTRLECRLADKVWCDSPSMRRYVVAQGLCKPDKVVVLGNGSVNGVDSSKTFSPEYQTGQRERIRELMAISPHDLVIGFVGRITADKGMHELAQAWRQLSQERSDVHLLLVGPFEPLDPLDAADFALFHEDSRVHVTGTQKKVAPYFAAMDVFAMPSYREGFGITNIEAASMCLPVVASSIPGCVDSVQDGVTGTLVPVKDGLRLLAALREYCDDAALRRKHGQAGRSRVIAEFGPERIWQELESLYTGSSSGRRGGRS